jgi:hypothetical protein
VEDRISDHLDLACASVAGVHLEAVVRDGEEGPLVSSAPGWWAGGLAIGSDIGLDEL